MGHHPRSTGMALQAEGLMARHVIDRAVMADDVGVPSLWTAQLANQRDSMSLLAAASSRTSRATLGAAIVPTYTRPPVALAQEAATIAELSEGRFVLGVGSGHPLVSSWMDPRSSGSPAAFLREYTTIVRTLLAGEDAHVDGEAYQAHARLGGSLVSPPTPVMLGAFGPRLCRIAAELCDGLLLWMCSARYVEQVALPAVRIGLEARTDGAFADTGFPVVVFIPGGVSNDLDRDQEIVATYVATYARVPNYRRMYERSGLGDAVASAKVGQELLAAVTAIGGEELVRERVAEYHTVGASRVVLAPMASGHYDEGLFERTAQLVADIARDSA